MKLLKGKLVINMKYNVQPTFSYSDEEMIDIISSAVYDIGYWAVIDNDSNEWWDARSELPKGSTFEDLMYHILKKGEKIIIMDAEDDEESWDLTLAKLLNGIKLTIENSYWNGKIMDIDGEVGDMIFQYALFGEVVFG
jgi:hypothetical protein